MNQEMELFERMNNLGKLKFIEVDENKVEPDAIGTVDFDKGIIKYPTFRPFLQKLGKKTREVYRPIIELIKQSVKRHEVLEYITRPRNAREEAAYEAQSLMKSGDVIGMTMRRRLALYGERVSTYVFENSGLAKMYRQWRENFGEYVEVLDYMVDNILNLREPEPVEMME
jgi:hypothetical protein